MNEWNKCLAKCFVNVSYLEAQKLQLMIYAYAYECVFVLIFANLFMLRKFAKMAIEIPLPVISLNVIVNENRFKITE